MCSYCDLIAMGDTSYEYERVWSQWSTNTFVSPRASESALSYTHQVHNALMIAANDRILILTTLYSSTIYSDLKLSCFAIYRTESIPRHSGQVNPRSYSPRPRNCGRMKGWFASVHLVNRAPIYMIIGHTRISYMTLHISRWHGGLILTTHHLIRNELLAHEWNRRLVGD